MPTVSRARALAYLIAIVAVLAVGGKLLLGPRADARPAAASSAGAVGPAELVEVGGASDPVEAPPVVVHVVGAVRRPGLYQLEAGSRIADALRRAGGARKTAFLAAVNLAAPLVDGQQVVIPARGAVPQAVAAEPAGSAAAPAGPVHLNIATLEQLDALPGVGPVTAQKILDYRDAHGPFRAVDELDAIPGIGPARLEQLRELVAP